MTIPESSLSAPTIKWLEGRGYECYCEVPVQGCCVDIVGHNENLLIAVELKKCLSWKVMKQATLHQNWANESWCAVGSKPRSASIETARRLGLGVFNPLTSALLAQAQPSNPYPAAHGRVMALLSYTMPGGVGGITTPINDGPAQQVARLVAPLRRRGMNWRAIFEKIPNHYANARSLASVMRSYGPCRAILEASDGDVDLWDVWQLQLQR